MRSEGASARCLRKTRPRRGRGSESLEGMRVRPRPRSRVRNVKILKFLGNGKNRNTGICKGVDR